MRSKKAALFHWILLGILLSVGTFFIFFNQFDFSSNVKGVWPLQFIRENFLEAELELLKLDVNAKNIGKIVLEKMALNGGFKESSDCGTVSDFNAWNEQDEWCSADVSSVAKDLAEEEFTAKFPQEKFVELKFDKDNFIGLGRVKEVVSPAGVYKFNNSFNVNLPFSLEEYSNLQGKAKLLVKNCQNKVNFHSCLDQNLNQEIFTSWHYSSCEPAAEEFKAEGRRVPFCAVGQGNLKYNFALDFTNTELFKVEIDHLVYDSVLNQYEITFIQDSAATGYNIYYTNWDSAEGFVPDTANSIFSLMPQELNFFYELKYIDNPTVLDCPVEKEPGNTYLCVDDGFKVVYVLQDGQIVPGEALVTVTTTKDNRESEIDGFIILE